MAELAPAFGIDTVNNPFGSLLSSDVLNEVRGLGATANGTSVELNKLLSDANDALREINAAKSNPNLDADAIARLEFAASDIRSAISGGNLNALRTLPLAQIQRVVDDVKTDEQAQAEADGYAEEHYAVDMAEEARERAEAEYYDRQFMEDGGYPDFDQYNEVQQTALASALTDWKANDPEFAKLVEERKSLTPAQVDAAEALKTATQKEVEKAAEANPEMQERILRMSTRINGQFTSEDRDNLAQFQKTGDAKYLEQIEANGEQRIGNHALRYIEHSKYKNLLGEQAPKSAEEAKQYYTEKSLNDGSFDPAITRFNDAVKKAGGNEKAAFDSLSESERKDLVTFHTTGMVKGAMAMESTVSMARALNKGKGLSTEEIERYSAMDAKEFVRTAESKGLVKTDEEKKALASILIPLDGNQAAKQEILKIQTNDSLSADEKRAATVAVYQKASGDPSKSDSMLTQINYFNGVYAIEKDDFTKGAVQREMEKAQASVTEKLNAIDKEAEVRATGAERDAVSVNDRRTGASDVYAKAGEAASEAAAGAKDEATKKALTERAQMFSTLATETKKNEMSGWHKDGAIDEAWGKMSPAEQAAFKDKADFAAQAKSSTPEEIMAMNKANDAGRLDAGGSTKLRAMNKFVAAQEDRLDRAADDARKTVDTAMGQAKTEAVAGAAPSTPAANSNEPAAKSTVLAEAKAAGNSSISGGEDVGHDAKVSASTPKDKEKEKQKVAAR